METNECVTPVRSVLLLKTALNFDMIILGFLIESAAYTGSHGHGMVCLDAFFLFVIILHYVRLLLNGFMRGHKKRASF